MACKRSSVRARSSPLPPHLGKRPWQQAWGVLVVLVDRFDRDQSLCDPASSTCRLGLVPQRKQVPDHSHLVISLDHHLWSGGAVGNPTARAERGAQRLEQWLEIPISRGVLQSRRCLDAGDDRVPLAATFLSPNPRVLQRRWAGPTGCVFRADTRRGAAVLAGDGLLERCAGEESCHDEGYGCAASKSCNTRVQAHELARDAAHEPSACTQHQDAVLSTIPFIRAYPSICAPPESNPFRPTPASCRLNARHRNPLDSRDDRDLPAALSDCS